MSNFSSYGLKIFLWVFFFAPQTSERETFRTNVEENLNLLKQTELENVSSVPDLVTNTPSSRNPENDEFFLFTPISSGPDLVTDAPSNRNPEDDEFFLFTPINEIQEAIDSNTIKDLETTLILSSKSTQSLDKITSRRKSKRKSRRRHELFHRRMLSDEMMNSPITWLHCQDLLTPYINGNLSFGNINRITTFICSVGYKSDIKQPVFMKITDLNIQSFISLLNLTATGLTKDEIYSILFHVSQFQIRLFQWEHPAIIALMDTLTNGYPHTFRNLQDGVKYRLKQWHLDLNNTTMLLLETKMIRPLCLKVSEYDGSTRSSGGVRYTKPSVVKSTCLYRNGEYGIC